MDRLSPTGVSSPCWSGRGGGMTGHLWKVIIVGYWFVILLVTFLRILHGN
jgi:hypothetical protein